MKAFVRKQCVLFLIACALLALAPLRLFAALYWDADGSASGNNAATGAGLGGTGNWDAAGKWFDGAADVSWAAGGDAVFYGTAGTVTLGSAQSANSLAFKTNGYTVTGSTLTFGASPANITTDAGVTVTIASTIAGSATMTKLGPGTLVLANNNNTNTADTTGGGWRVEGGGVLVISADTALGAALPDIARNTVTDIQFNQSTIRFGADMTLSQNRRTKVNTNSSTQNLGDAVIDVNQHTVSWFGSIQGGLGSLRVTDGNDNGGMLILGTDKISSINPFGSALPGGTVNLTVEGHVVVQTAGTVTPTNGELGAETGANGERLAIKLQGGGQIRAESGDYKFQRNLILGPGGGSLDTGAWIQHFDGGTITGTGSLSKYGTGTLILDNPTATWCCALAPGALSTFVHSGTLQLGVGGSNGLLPGTLAAPLSVVLDAGATLKFLRGSNKSFFDAISGAGGVTIANVNNAKVRLVSNNSYTGLTRIESGVLMIGQGNPGEPGSIASSVLNNGTIDFNRVENISYGFSDATISGTGNLIKEAAGKLTLVSANTYSGGTTVLAGTLIAANTSGSATGSGAVSVSAGATLAGSGTIAGAVSIASGGHLAPGTSAGNLTVGSLSLVAGSVLDYELGAPGTGDRTTITSSGGLSVTGGTVNITALAGFGVGQYPLLDYTGSFIGSPTNLILGAAPSGFTYSFVNNATNTSIDVVVVPEPSGLALVACLATGCLFRARSPRPQSRDRWSRGQRRAGKAASTFGMRAHIPRPAVAAIWINPLPSR
jgi:fibronectin-binding autotransporter adhesin